jgi:hypothetical protein
VISNARVSRAAAGIRQHSKSSAAGSMGIPSILAAHSSDSYNDLNAGAG